MAARPETIAKVCKAAQCLHPGCETPSPTDTPAGLGADSLDLLEFIMLVEETCNVEIEDDGPGMETTLADWAMHVDELLEART